MFRLRYSRKCPILVLAKIVRHNCVGMISLCECIAVPTVSLPMNVDCKMVDVDLLGTLLLFHAFVHVEMFPNLVTAHGEIAQKDISD